MSKEVIIVKLDADGEQTQYIYENSFSIAENLVNAVIMEYFGIKNWWSDVYNRKASEIKQQMVKSSNFYIWADKDKKITFVARKKSRRI